MRDEKKYFNAFNLVPAIGAVRLTQLQNHFPDLKTAWSASLPELELTRIPQNALQQLIETRKRVDPDAEYEKLLNQNISLLTPADDGFPALLREIPQSPCTLYVKGEFLTNRDPAVAVVGTRRVTDYGKRVTEDMVRDLVRSNVAVISGLALGADSVAHKTAVNYSGKTAAVLACGLDSVYPAANRQLAERILEAGGALVSELPLGTPPLRHHFPNRNRIISGLALGTLVVEAAAESGALITARHALEQNRQVFAIPGSIYSELSAGPHNLIKMGAKLVSSVQDILEELNLEHLQQEIIIQKIIGDTKEEQLILDQLSREPIHADQITKNTGLQTSEVSSTLTILEMKGKIKNLGANQYVLSR